MTKKNKSDFDTAGADLGARPAAPAAPGKPGKSVLDLIQSRPHLKRLLGGRLHQLKVMEERRSRRAR